MTLAFLMTLLLVVSINVYASRYAYNHHDASQYQNQYHYEEPQNHHYRNHHYQQRSLYNQPHRHQRYTPDEEYHHPPQPHEINYHHQQPQQHHNHHHHHQQQPNEAIYNYQGTAASAAAGGSAVSDTTHHHQQIQDTILNSLRSAQIPVQPVNLNHPPESTNLTLMIAIGSISVIGLIILSYSCFILFSFKHTFIQRLLSTKLPSLTNHSYEIGSPRAQKELHIKHVILTSSGFDKVNVYVLLFLERLFYWFKRNAWLTQEQLYFHITKRPAIILTTSPNSSKLDKTL